MTNKKKKTFLLIFIAVLVVALIIGLYFALHSNGNTLNQTDNIDDNISESTTVPEKYNEYYDINNEFIGWVKIEGTAIDYPVAQCEDNSYYLTHNFNKEYEARGSIYMAFDCDPNLKSKNTVLHGHNWLDGTVFSELENYQDFEYYKKHPVIEFNTRTQMHKWKIISVFITSASESEDNGYVFNYVYPNMGGKNFEGYSNELKKRSLFNTGVDYNKNDSFLTLSTCTRSVDTSDKRADCRIVIVARMVRESENEAVDVSKATENQNPKYPQIWYTNKNIENPYKSDKQWYPYELE